MSNIFPIDFEEKLTMAQDDYILFSDSEDGNKIKKAQYKNLKGEPGTPGQDGAAATISVGTTTTGAAGSSASVTNSGTSSAAVFNFTIPQGAKGEDGDDGAAATITVGTTTTLPAGSSATVTNSGTSSAAVLNFGIPQGDTGVQDAKVFTLSSTSDLTNAQAAYDWYASGKEAIILYSGRYYYFKSTGGGSVYFAVNEYTTLDNTDVTSLVQKTLTLALSGTTVTSVSSWNMSLTNYNVLRTGKDYGTPYTPQYNGSPATKKYVDDNVSTKQDTLVSGTNIKTINNTSLLGSGDITISGGGSDIEYVTQAEYNALLPGAESDGKHYFIYDEGIISVTGVTLDESEITLTTVGDTYQLTATVSPNDATDKSVNWSSSDNTVATVSQTGLVTCVTPGTCTITVTTTDGGFTDTCGVTDGQRHPGANTVGYRPLTDDYDDYSGNNYNLTNNSTNLTTVDGVKCCDMNNSKCTANMAVTSLPYTMVFWNKSKVSGGNFSLMWQYSGDWGGSGFGGGGNNFEVRYGNTTDKDTMVPITVDTNWHMYALTFDTTGCYVYFDGVQTANPKQSLVNSVANTTPFYIGGSYSGSVVGNNYMGAVIIEDKVWSAQEISDYYDLTKGDYGIS